MIQQYLTERDNGSFELFCNTFDPRFDEFLRNSKETGYLIDQELLDVVRNNCEINVQTNEQNKCRVLEFLKALKVRKIHQLKLALSSDGMQQVDNLELFKISIDFKFECTFIRLTGFSGQAEVSFFKRFCSLILPGNIGLLPLMIKESTDNFDLYHTMFKAEEIESVFHIVADLVRYVLSHHRQKRIWVINNNSYLIQKIRRAFGNAEHFDECIKFR